MCETLAYGNTSMVKYLRELRIGYFNSFYDFVIEKAKRPCDVS